MAEVVLPVAQLPALHAPPFCARTGRPATETRELTLIRSPWWAWLFLLLGCLLGLIVIWVISPRVTVTLPIATETRRRHNRALAVMVVSVVVFLASVFTLGVLPSAVCGIGALASAVTYAIAHHRFVQSWVGGVWFREDAVRLTRLDPAMADALAAQAAPVAL